MMLVACNNETNLKATFYEVQVTDADWVPMEDMFHYAKVEMPEITEHVFHHGTVEEPVLLIPAAQQKPLKIVDDGKLYILLPDGTRFDATGKKVNNL